MKFSLPELKAQHWRGNHSPELEEAWEPGQSRVFYVFADERRNYSGVFLKKDQLYHFQIKEIHGWNDASIPAHPINGWGDLPFSWWKQRIRDWGRAWSASPCHDLMVLLGSIGDRGEPFAFADHVEKTYSNEPMIQGRFHSPESGELVAFANDAQLDYFYNNNSGYLVVTIERLQLASGNSPPAE